MLLMYADESGDPGYRNDAHPYQVGNGPSPWFVRVGVIIDERDWQKVRARIRQFRLDNSVPESVEFHAAEMWRGRRGRKGRGGWFSSIRSTRRRELIRDYLALVGQCKEITLVGVCIDKPKVHGAAGVRVRNPKLRSLEFLTERFNQVLRNRRPQPKGLMVLDSVEVTDDQVHREFQEFLYKGSNNIQSERFIESVLFAPSHSTEFLQMADMCANALFRERCGCKPSSFDLISPRLFHHGGKLAGMKTWP